MLITRKPAVSLFLVLTFFISPCFAGETLKLSAPPSIWLQEKDGKTIGPVIDLIREIFTELDIEVAVEPLPWKRAIGQMKSGKLDMIPVIFYTEERAQFMDYSTPYTTVPTAIFVPLGKTFPFTSLEDLRGKKGAMVGGDSISKEFEAFEPNLDLLKVSYYEQLLKMLGDKRADYAVAAKYGFLIEAKKTGLSDKIEILANPVASRNLHFAISKKSKFVKYMPIINEKIATFKAEGKIEKMVHNTIEMAAGTGSK